MASLIKERLGRHVNLARTFTGVGVAQAALQAISLCTGLLVVRLLPPEEYAYYTLAGGVLGFLSIISDSGMNSGAYAVAGKVWRDRQAMGDLVFTLISLRKQFATFVIVVALPVMGLLLWKNGASSLTILGLCGACGVQFWVALPALGYGLAPALHQRVQDTQRISIIQATLRLISIGGVLCMAKNAILIYLVAVPAQLWTNKKLEKLSADLSGTGSVRPEFKSDLLRMVGKVFPGSLYYAISGQITILLVSLYGTTKTLADVGALGRLGQIMAVFSAIAGVLLVPRFARAENSPGRLLRIYVAILGAVSLACGFLCLTVWFFPKPALWLLGGHYSMLGAEIALQFISASIGLVCGIAYQLGAVRGVVYNPLLAIPAAIIYQGLSIYIFDFSSARGVLLFSIGLFILQGLQTISFFIGTTLRGHTGPLSVNRAVKNNI